MQTDSVPVDGTPASFLMRERFEGTNRAGASVVLGKGRIDGRRDQAGRAQGGARGTGGRAPCGTGARRVPVRPLLSVLVPGRRARRPDLRRGGLDAGLDLGPLLRL